MHGCLRLVICYVNNEAWYMVEDLDSYILYALDNGSPTPLLEASSVPRSEISFCSGGCVALKIVPSQREWVWYGKKSPGRWQIPNLPASSSSWAPRCVLASRDS